LFTRFNDEFGKRDLESITPDEILSFLTRLTEGNSQTTKRNRYSSLKAFFNHIRNTIDFEIQNPCDTPILRKIFREKRPQQWKIIEKDLIDEFIFKNISKTKQLDLKCAFFPITCNAARIMVKKAGESAGVNLRPHDLRRHAATHASRSGTPIEIVSKVILRHAHLSTTKSFNCIPSKF
jgi:integrase